MRGKRGSKHSVDVSEVYGQTKVTLENGAVVSGDTGKQPSKKLRPPKLKRWQQVVLVAVVALLVGATVWAIWIRKPDNTLNDEEYQRARAKLIRLTEDANHNAGRKQSSQSVQALEQYLTTPNLPDDLRLEATSQLATAYLNADQYDQAIAAFDSVRQLRGHDTASVAAGKAMAYQGKGDKQNAITYYQQAIDLSQKEQKELQSGNPDIITYQQQIVGYQMIIKQLQGAK